MKTNSEQETSKMEAYLKFYAEYFGCKSAMKQGCGKTGKTSESTLSTAKKFRRKNK